MTLKRTIRVVGFVLFFSVIITVGYYYRAHLDAYLLENYLHSLGNWAPIIFIMIYTLGTIALLPGVIFTIAGGVIFGPIYGVIYNMIGASIGLTCAFLIARYFAQEWVAKLAGKKMTIILNGINTEGWRFVVLTRLSPIVPFNVLNYVLGVTQIPFGQYMIASVTCIFPACAAYTYLGYLGTEAAQAKEGLIQKALLGLFLLVLAVYARRIFWLIKRMRGRR